MRIARWIAAGSAAVVATSAACSIDAVTFTPGTPALIEDCAAAGDEDGNGLADCADPACSVASECASVCGDGVRMGAEACDDANLIDGDGCDSNCTATGCGNGVRTAGEACDDGNDDDTDACRNDCTLGTGFMLPAIADATVYDGPGSSRSTNYGSDTTLSMLATAVYRADVYIRFDLSGLAPGTPLRAARLHLVPTAADATVGVPLELNAVPASWLEDEITWALQPPPGLPRVVSSSPAQPLNEWILDVTPIVQREIEVPSQSFGLRLRFEFDGSVPVVASFQSRETTRPPTLEIIR